MKKKEEEIMPQSDDYKQKLFQNAKTHVNVSHSPLCLCVEYKDQFKPRETN